MHLFYILLINTFSLKSLNILCTAFYYSLVNDYECASYNYK